MIPIIQRLYCSAEDTSAWCDFYRDANHVWVGPRVYSQSRCRCGTWTWGQVVAYDIHGAQESAMNLEETP